jgi:hypothetical protein
MVGAIAGQTIVSPGPITDVLGFKKMIGSFGTSDPISFAWSA